MILVFYYSIVKNISTRYCIKYEKKNIYIYKNLRIDFTHAKKHCKINLYSYK